MTLRFKGTYCAECDAIGHHRPWCPLKRERRLAGLLAALVGLLVVMLVACCR